MYDIQPIYISLPLLSLARKRYLDLSTFYFLHILIIPNYLLMIWLLTSRSSIVPWLWQSWWHTQCGISFRGRRRSLVSKIWCHYGARLLILWRYGSPMLYGSGRASRRGGGGMSRRIPSGFRGTGLLPSTGRLDIRGGRRMLPTRSFYLWISFKNNFPGKRPWKGGKGRGLVLNMPKV